MSDVSLAVLLLEPDPVTQELYSRELSRYFRVFAGRNAADALRLLLTHDIQAIVLEPAWPDEQGWHFLATLRQTTRHPHLPVIICSVLDERRLGYQMGVAAYCVKPVLPTTLLATLRQVLASEPETSEVERGRSA